MKFISLFYHVGALLRFYLPVFLFSSCSHQNINLEKPENKLLPPPMAMSLPHKLLAHGDVRDDPYFWPKDRNNPEVINYLKAENAYTEQFFLPLRPLEEKLFVEIKQRDPVQNDSVAVKKGDFLYFSRKIQG